MGRLRDAWNALRGYAAAQDSRASAWAPSGGSATAEIGMAAATVARRARDAVRNDPYAVLYHWVLRGFCRGVQPDRTWLPKQMPSIATWRAASCCRTSRSR
jgi:hypothetical protein